MCLLPLLFVAWKPIFGLFFGFGHGTACAFFVFCGHPGPGLSVSGPAKPLPSQCHMSQAVKCLNAMVNDALKHIPDCMTYMSKLKDPSVFQVWWQWAPHRHKGALLNAGGSQCCMQIWGFCSDAAPPFGGRDGRSQQMIRSTTKSFFAPRKKWAGIN